jgi:hypothetical protein
MARTDATLVKAVLAPGGDYSLKRNHSLAPFISVANGMITRLVAKAAEDALTFTTQELIDLETWVAAWAYKCSDQQYASNNTDKAGASYRGQHGKGLEANLYGQMALVMDHTGLLAALASGENSASLDWGGKHTQDQDDYDDRNTEVGLY